MKWQDLFDSHRDEIVDILTKNGLENPRWFWINLNFSDSRGTPVLLVDPSNKTTLFHIIGAEMSLETLLCLHVDVVTPDNLPDKFKSRILEHAKPL